MAEIPRDRRLDSGLAFLRDPYRFISKTCRELNSKLFQARVLFQSGICMQGAEAAELFYDEARFKRRNVAPRRFQKTLFGVGGVQGLDGAAHKLRKQMFMSLMSPDRIRNIGERTADSLDVYARSWAKQDDIVLYDQFCALLTHVACDWAEVPLADEEVSIRTRDITGMFDYAGSIGPKHWRARLGRRRSERWIRQIVERVRSKELPVSPESAAFVIAMHRDLSGHLLDAQIAAVELLNVIRPIVAVSVFLTFAALALHDHVECREGVTQDPENYPHLFAQEVRRFYPFFPAVGAETRHEFEWKGYRFPKGVPVLLDLYGTNHDERAWQSPDTFMPERFRTWDGNPFNFVPQGGGDQVVNHRCPGEPISIELLKVTGDFFARRVRYEVPSQELEIDFRRVPALPRSRFRIRNVALL